MRTPRALVGLLLIAVLIALEACSGPWVSVRNVPEDGYEQTVNYQFQAQVHSDDSGTCKMMVVRVKALSKLYTRQEPPSRLQLFDDDCTSPLRFERVSYLSKEGGQVRLSGIDVVHFLGQYSRLEDELVGWLWREGVI